MIDIQELDDYIFEKDLNAVVDELLDLSNFKYNQNMVDEPQGEIDYPNFVDHLIDLIFQKRRQKQWKINYDSTVTYLAAQMETSKKKIETRLYETCQALIAFHIIKVKGLKKKKEIIINYEL